MGKPARKRLSTFIRQFFAHLRAVIRRKERPGEALNAVAKDARRLLHKLRVEPDEEGYRKAKQYTNRGVRAYNEADYEKAVFYFTKATKSDDAYALGWLYLGDAQHKQGHATEAIQAWQRAAEVGHGTEAGERAMGHLNSAIRKVRTEFLG
jgi:tetratricopeptide (TPR) repeat protein